MVFVVFLEYLVFWGILYLLVLVEVIVLFFCFVRGDWLFIGGMFCLFFFDDVRLLGMLRLL